MIDIQILDWCSLVTVVTDIDIASYRELEEALISCDTALPICVDFSKCPFMDSSGLGVILRTRKALDERFWIVAPDKTAVRRLAHTAGVATFLHIAESVADVRRLFEKEEAG